jgi:hypothetical protein
LAIDWRDLTKEGALITRSSKVLAISIAALAPAMMLSVPADARMLGIESLVTDLLPMS